MSLAKTERIDEATRIMDAFAERTGVGGAAQRRYLWTDAFAVCNELALAERTSGDRHRARAEALIEGVHRTLGRHRPDDQRRGWLSGLGDDEAALHPTRGGLRIGKPLPERAAGEPVDERLEWDRDGQYFHYLTKWMHALDRAARATKQPRYNAWARELMHVAAAAFTFQPARGAGPRMAWKMSIDLSRPLVPSMGQHDPLDGFVTCAELRATAAALGEAPGADLCAERDTMHAMTTTRDWLTTDPLGLGGLLVDAARVAQLVALDATLSWALVETLLALAHEGIRRYLMSGELRHDPTQRLAFRELGLAIGLAALPILETAIADADSTAVLATFRRVADYRALGEGIIDTWRSPRHRAAVVWHEHEDINEVMLATALLPDGVVRLR